LVYVDNVVDALLLAARADVPNGAIYHLVDPEGISQKDYIACVRRSGREVRVWYTPMWMLTMAGWGVELLGKILKRSVPLTPYRVRSLTPVAPCECGAAHAQLGWTSRIGIQEGMARTFPPVLDA
jgi:nucleoside-diphosphate-sugar epimerase